MDNPTPHSRTGILASESCAPVVERYGLDRMNDKAWQQVVEYGWEGLVAKDPASRYVGGRTLRWLKVKQRDYRVPATSDPGPGGCADQ